MICENSENKEEIQDRLSILTNLSMSIGQAMYKDAASSENHDKPGNNDKDKVVDID